MQQIRFKNNCGCIVDEELLREAICYAFPKFRKKKPQKRVIFLSQVNPTPVPAISIQGKTYFISRIIAMYACGNSLDNKSVTHHVDGNSLNNVVDNLQLMPQGEHARIHCTGHRCGPSEADKNKTIELRQKGCTADQLGEIYNCSRQTILRRLVEWGQHKRRPRGTA